MAVYEPLVVGLCQLNPAVGEPDANLKRAITYIEEAAARGANMILFPEMFLQGYRADDELAALAETVPGPCSEALIAQARQYHVYIVMGMARSEASFPDCIYNTACVVAPDGRVGHYDKIHLGTFYPYHEGVFWAPGRTGLIVDTPFGRCAIQICYDMWFPELSLGYAMAGADVNIVISAGPSGFVDDWSTLLRARSIENAFPTVYCNTVGQQKDSSFFGGSVIVDHNGAVVLDAGVDKETLAIGAVDVAGSKLLRRQRHMFADVRPARDLELVCI